MERYKFVGDRNQTSLIPLCFDDMISEENPVRAIDAIVESMEILELGFKYSKTASTGRKPYNPVDMFKLYTYSCFNGIRSSRKIERECNRNIEVMWLIGNITPDFKTIADFRKDNKAAIKRAFSKFNMICDGLGLIGKKMIAVDGSKFRANNSNDQYCTVNKTIKKIEHYEEQAKKYFAMLDANDEQERENQSLDDFENESIKGKIDHIRKRIAELNELRAEKEYFASVTVCRDCAVKEKCTKARYRCITEHRFQKYAEVVDQRTRDNKEVIQLRKCLAEHPFGTIKRALVFGYFLTRRTENVRTETVLHFLTYNIKRVINILGVLKLREAI